MGTIDEHWCSVCKRKLEKKKDKYVEFELLNIRVKGKKKKGNICKNCVDANPELKKAVDIMIKAGNPLFTPIVGCASAMDCETFEVSKDSRVRCRHIAVIADTIYCKRSHVGTLKLPREKAEVRREEARILTKTIEKYIKDPNVKKLLNTELVTTDFVKPLHEPPSSVVET